MNMSKKKTESSAHAKSSAVSNSTSKKLKPNNQDIQEFLEIETKLGKQVNEDSDKFITAKKSPKANISSILSKTPIVTGSRKPLFATTSKDSTDNRQRKTFSGPNASLRSLVMKDSSNFPPKDIELMATPTGSPLFKRTPDRKSVV